VTIRQDPKSTGQIGEDTEISAGSSNILGLASRIRERLRNSEKKVVNVVIAEPDWVTHASVAEVARRAGVSEPTVMRSCASLGLSGFRALQIALAQDLALGIPATQSVITSSDTTATVLVKILDYFVTNLDHTRRVLQPGLVEAAVDILSSARQILFLGLGESAIVAEDAQQRFFLFGVPCFASADTHMQFIAAYLTDPQTAVVAISHTGKTPDIIEMVRAAKANKAMIITITGGASPLSDFADVPIIVEALENTDIYTPTVSRLAHLVILDVLATAVALRRPASDIERLRQMKSHLAVFAHGEGPGTPGQRSPARQSG
jgi:RpiR family carbohydrate utilization transcriptional regulator